MDTLARNIEEYRKLLRRDISTVTRRTLEWLLVNAARTWAGLEPAQDIEAGTDQGPLLTWIANRAVSEAVRAPGAQFGNFQLYIAPDDVLLMLASHNFEPIFVDNFAFLCPDGKTACSRAFASGRRVIIEDVAKDEKFKPHVPAARTAGFCSVQSTPLKSGTGKTIGVLSTHFASPRTFSREELAEMDIHAGNVSRQLAHEWA